MKKLFCILIVVLTLLSLAACKSAKDTETATTNSTDNQTSNSSVSQNQTTEKNSESAPTTSKPAQSTGGIDVDLTNLSSTMIYSEVYNMMYTPDDYIGKTVKMNGLFAIGYSYKPDGSMDESTLRTACIVMDATACCSQGIEFVLTGEHTYPDDYPELNSEITITGTFETYEENGFKYCRLVNATLAS